MIPYTRALHPDDYHELSHAGALRLFQASMALAGVPHREWHQHRVWEYASILQQLDDLHTPSTAAIVDVGAGASFFDPYLAMRYPHLLCVDSMAYGDVTSILNAQRRYYGLDLLFEDQSVEHLPQDWSDRFDVTLCISTIEHAADHDAAMRELVRITKPGGYVFITSDYFRDVSHWEQSTSKSLQVTPYSEAFVLTLPERFGLEFVGDVDLEYKGDFVQNYSFVNICLRKV